MPLDKKAGFNGNFATTVTLIKKNIIYNLQQRYYSLIYAAVLLCLIKCLLVLGTNNDHVVQIFAFFKLSILLDQIVKVLSIKGLHRLVANITRLKFFFSKESVFFYFKDVQKILKLRQTFFTLIFCFVKSLF